MLSSTSCPVSNSTWPRQRPAPYCRLTRPSPATPTRLCLLQQRPLCREFLRQRAKRKREVISPRRREAFCRMRVHPPLRYRKFRAAELSQQLCRSLLYCRMRGRFLFLPKRSLQLRKQAKIMCRMKLDLHRFLPRCRRILQRHRGFSRPRQLFRAHSASSIRQPSPHFLSSKTRGRFFLVRFLGRYRLVFQRAAIHLHRRLIRMRHSYLVQLHMSRIFARLLRKIRTSLVRSML